jgi:uncharacterized membrane protein
MVRSIYQAAKQLSEAIFLPKSEGFRRVVLIEYPRKGVYSLGFVTGVARGEIQERTQARVINVFVPTTPNPTSGWYILVPEKDTVPLTMTAEDAFKLIISGGMLTPPSPLETKAVLEDRSAEVGPEEGPPEIQERSEGQ